MMAQVRENSSARLEDKTNTIIPQCSAIRRLQFNSQPQSKHFISLQFETESTRVSGPARTANDEHGNHSICQSKMQLLTNKHWIQACSRRVAIYVPILETLNSKDVRKSSQNSINSNCIHNFQNHLEISLASFYQNFQDPSTAVIFQNLGKSIPQKFHAMLFLTNQTHTE